MNIHLLISFYYFLEEVLHAPLSRESYILLSTDPGLAVCWMETLFIRAGWALTKLLYTQVDWILNCARAFKSDRLGANRCSFFHVSSHTNVNPDLYRTAVILTSSLCRGTTLLATGHSPVALYHIMLYYRLHWTIVNPSPLLILTLHLSSHHVHIHT